MRKLILTSFTARTGDTEFTEQRIVVIKSPKYASSGHDRELATDVFKNWFKVYRPELELLSIVPHDTVEAPKVGDPIPVPDTEENDNEDSLWKPLKSIPSPVDEEQSVNVIMDINGEGEYFDTAWYDFRDKKWVNCNSDFNTAITEHPELVRWMYCPKDITF